MKLEKCELPKRAFYKKTKMYLFLTEFIESGAKCARVNNWEEEYVNISSAYLNQNYCGGCGKRLEWSEEDANV